MGLCPSTARHADEQVQTRPEQAQELVTVQPSAESTAELLARIKELEGQLTQQQTSAATKPTDDDQDFAVLKTQLDKFTAEKELAAQLRIKVSQLTEQLEQDVTKFKSTTQELEGEIATLRTKLESSQQSTATPESESKSDSELLKQKLTKAIAENEALQSQFAAAQEQLAVFQTTFTTQADTFSSTAEFSKLHDKLTTAESAQAELRKNLLQAQSYRKTAEAEAQEAKAAVAELQQKIKLLQSEIETLTTTQAQAASDDRDQLLRKYNKAELKVSRLQETIATLQEAAKELASSTAGELVALKDQTFEMQLQLDSKTAELGYAQSAIGSLREVKEQLESQLQGASAKKKSAFDANITAREERTIKSFFGSATTEIGIKKEDFEHLLRSYANLIPRYIESSLEAEKATNKEADPAAEKKRLEELSQKYTKKKKELEGLYQKNTDMQIKAEKGLIWINQVDYTDFRKDYDELHDLAIEVAHSKRRSTYSQSPHSTPSPTTTQGTVRETADVTPAIHTTPTEEAAEKKEVVTSARITASVSTQTDPMTAAMIPPPPPPPPPGPQSTVATGIPKPPPSPTDANGIPKPPPGPPPGRALNPVTSPQRGALLSGIQNFSKRGLRKTNTGSATAAGKGGFLGELSQAITKPKEMPLTPKDKLKFIEDYENRLLKFILIVKKNVGSDTYLQTCKTKITELFAILETDIATAEKYKDKVTIDKLTKLKVKAEKLQQQKMTVVQIDGRLKLYQEKQASDLANVLLKRMNMLAAQTMPEDEEEGEGHQTDAVLPDEWDAPPEGTGEEDTLVKTTTQRHAKKDSTTEGNTSDGSLDLTEFPPAPLSPETVAKRKAPPPIPRKPKLAIATKPTGKSTYSPRLLNGRDTKAPHYGVEMKEVLPGLTTCHSTA
jgi:hypothetical protein